MSDQVLYEKVIYQSFHGMQASETFVRPLDEDPPVLGMFHGGYLLLYGEALNDANIPIFQLDAECIPETRRILPYKRDTASTLTRLRTKQGEPHPYCTRMLLENTEQELKDRGIEFLIGTEIEMFVSSVKDGTPIHEDSFGGSSLSTPTHPATVLLEEVIPALQQMGIPILKFHTEWIPGILEIVLKPLSPLAAAEAVIRCKETIRAIALTQGYRASFAPTASLGGSQVPVGIHHHISLRNQDNAPLPQDVGFRASGSLTAQERSFVAGVLKHFPSLMAISMPHAASYARRTSAACFVGYGTEIHGGMALRLIYTLDRNTRRPSYRFEYRIVDGTSDPYLVLASVLKAGGQAIIDRLPLVHDDLSDPNGKHLEEFFHKASMKQAQALGIEKQTPHNLAEALDELEADVELTAMLGKELVDMHIVARKLYAQQFNGKGADARDKWLQAMY